MSTLSPTVLENEDTTRTGECLTVLKNDLVAGHCPMLAYQRIIIKTTTLP